MAVQSLSARQTAPQTQETAPHETQQLEDTMPVEVMGREDGMHRHVTCQHCGAILRYMRHDVLEYDKREIIADPGTVGYVICPTCNRKVMCRNFQHRR